VKPFLQDEVVDASIFGFRVEGPAKIFVEVGGFAFEGFQSVLGWESC